ncbi:helix-turn-helix domain-containing protein [Leucothrix pacifica]|uniref:Transcriptional regulator n=1 Tax=Leucothrix pacifica TaxID=1247513 RepID=A0A317C3F6_9GAMM|nr:helix-turn-helix domain-containing protein [Leucothrix pacifica]PWQ92837.1 transcriptional regulator [Leucothrix pacifica]
MSAIQEAMNHWEYIAPVLTVPSNEKEYNKLVDDLDSVLDAGGADENHPLAGLAERMGDLVSAYENQQGLVPQSTGIDALKFLMESHHIKQSELSEVGSQGVVSEVLSGKRSLNVEQIKKLSGRFQVSPAVFISPLQG